MDALRKMSQARTELILGQPFFGALALRLDAIEAPGCGTAYTDGRVIGYDPAFVAKLTIGEAAGLVAHEVMHCALGHPWRRDGRDMRTWNEACDMAINPIIIEAGMALPKGGLFPRKGWENQGAEWIYARLMEEKANQPDPPPGGGGSGDGQGEPWNFGGVQDPPPSGNDPNAPSPAEEQAGWEVATLQAAQAAQAAGKLPGGIKRTVDEIKRPKVNWKSALRRFVQQAAKADFSWRLPNTRYLAGGLYLPGLRSESMPPLVLAVDTSGSISQQDLADFQAEAQALLEECAPEAVHVLCCDTHVGWEKDFVPGDLIQIDPVGGGGTLFAPVFDRVEELGLQPACLVYLTDLEGPFPAEAPDYPVLWVATSRGQAPWGETLEMR